MRKESLDFLHQLLTTASPGGTERANQRVWCDYVRHFADEVRTDAYGNAIAVLNPTGDPKILLDGHIDEIALMVKHIDDKGFIYFQKIGGVNPALIQAKRVNIHTAEAGMIRGVIGATAIHLRDRDEKDQKAPKMHELFIDIGAKDGKAAKKLVAVGDPITFVDDFELMGDNLVIARALDDKVGAFAVAETMRLVSQSKTKPKAAIYACSSIQEETGLNGAKMLVGAIKPDLAVAVEVTHATDTPGIDVKQHGEVKMSEGPTVSVGREHHPVLADRLRKVAKKEKIDIQIEAFSLSGGTNAYAFWTAEGGIPSALVSVPNRYMHSTVEMCDLRDVQAATNLLAAFCLDIKQGERIKVKV